MSPTPLFILLCSGEHQKIQMAAMTASVAAVSERPVSVMVSMSAIYAFARGVPNQERYEGSAFSKLMLERKVPDPLALFSQGKMLGDLKMYVCSMALDVAGWSQDDLVEDLFDDVVGLTMFLNQAETGQFITL